jgi:hypothetical protein
MQLRLGMPLTLVFPSVQTNLGAAPHTRHVTRSNSSGFIILVIIPGK